MKNKSAIAAVLGAAVVGLAKNQASKRNSKNTNSKELVLHVTVNYSAGVKDCSYDATILRDLWKYLEMSQSALQEWFSLYESEMRSQGYEDIPSLGDRYYDSDAYWSIMTQWEAMHDLEFEMEDYYDTIFEYTPWGDIKVLDSSKIRNISEYEVVEQQENYEIEEAVLTVASAKERDPAGWKELTLGENWIVDLLIDENADNPDWDLNRQGIENKVDSISIEPHWEGYIDDIEIQFTYALKKEQDPHFFYFASLDDCERMIKELVDLAHDMYKLDHGLSGNSNTNVFNIKVETESALPKMGKNNRKNSIRRF